MPTLNEQVEQIEDIIFNVGTTIKNIVNQKARPVKRNSLGRTLNF